MAAFGYLQGGSLDLSWAEVEGSRLGGQHQEKEETRDSCHHYQLVEDVLSVPVIIGMVFLYGDKPIVLQLAS